ncbi:hypothetical protein ACOMHN_023444 [Nucella lapillus]
MKFSTLLSLWCLSEILMPVCARPRKDDTSPQPSPQSEKSNLGKKSTLGEQILGKMEAREVVIEPHSTSVTKHHSVQDHQTVLRQEDSGTEEQNDDENEDNYQAKAADDCGISKLRCSEFFGSPCEKVNPVNVPEYGGYCRTSRATAEKRWKPCGGQSTGNRSACFCYKRAAVCCANLSAIPDLTIDNSHSILYLNFTSNSLTVLDQHVLANVPQLKWLILSRNNISRVHADALKYQKGSLNRFELAYNQFGTYIDPHNFTKAVNSVRSLQILDVNQTRFSYAKREVTGITWIMRHLRLRHLKQLFVDGGSKRMFYLSDVDPARLPELCKLSIKSHFLEKVYCCSAKSFNNSLEYSDEEKFMDDAEYPYPNRVITQYSCISPESRKEPYLSYCQNFSMPNLKLLNLANNSLVYVPHFCRPGLEGAVQSVVPNLSHLLLAINALINPRRYHFQCLDNLIFLGLTGNPLKKIESKIFQNLTKLQVADLRFTNVMQIDPNAFEHKTLRIVTIKSSNWFVDHSHDACCISPKLFEGSSLESVDLSYNVFRFAKNVIINTFLSPLRTVKTLRMAEVGLQSIPRVILEEFRHLETLDFQSNQMFQIPSNAFDNLTQLKFLDLSDNHLALPREDVLRFLIVTRNVHVNIESNPFSCTCDILEFLNLYKAYRVKHRHQQSAWPLLSDKGSFVGENYSCYAPEYLKRHDLQSVELTIHSCLLTISQEILIYVFCLLAIFFLLIYILLHKYRWQVRFWLYTLHVRLSKGQVGRGTDPNPVCRPRFNAFVSYCKEDSHFVINQVLPALERNSRLPLCIHERDFVPGRYISQNVVERMEESRHVLLILSNAFLQNDWCRFELFVAQKYGLIHRRIPVSILVLERLRVELMDAHVITMLQATPGIEWPGKEGNDRDVAHFWQRLGDTLGSRPVVPVLRGQPRIRPGSDSIEDPIQE